MAKKTTQRGGGRSGKGGRPSKGKRSERTTAGWLTAGTADVLDLYERSVQEPEAEVELIDQVWRELRNRPCQRIREDFCGTAAVSIEWVRRDETHEAVGVDLDPVPLARAEARAARRLRPAQRRRFELLEGDVRSTTSPRVDTLLAMNFSYFVFNTREALRDYFRVAREHLVEDGIMLLDAYGGSESHDEMEEERDLDGFTYVWDQHYYNPITAAVVNHIHFRFPDGTAIERAFTYKWRLWSLPEIQETLLEAGFSHASVYWEGTDETSGEGDGNWSISVRGEACPGWVAYIAAER